MSFLPSDSPIGKAMNVMNDPAFSVPPAAAECKELAGMGDQMSALCSVFGVDAPPDTKTLITAVKATTPTPDDINQAQAARSNYENLMSINERMTDIPASSKSLKTVGCEFIDTVFKAFKQAGKLVGDLVKSITGLLGKIDLTGILSVVGGIAGKVFSTATDMLKWMGTAMGPIKGAIQRALSALPSFASIKNNISDITKDISKFISKGLSTLNKWVSEGAQALAAGLKDLANTNFLAMFNSLNPCLDDIKKSAFDTKKIPTGVISAIQQQAGTLAT